MSPDVWADDVALSRSPQWADAGLTRIEGLGDADSTTLVSFESTPQPAPFFEDDPVNISAVAVDAHALETGAVSREAYVGFDCFLLTPDQARHLAGLLVASADLADQAASAETVGGVR